MIVAFDQKEQSNDPTDMDSTSNSGDPSNTSAQSTVPPRPKARRTHRACDRCRVKKSKCNGQKPCHTCKANERTCVFSALRRRDIRKWHCHMHDTVDEAIQRLYQACKVGGTFPGVLPEEKDGFVTTEDILHAMGFTSLDLNLPTADPQGAAPTQLKTSSQRLAGSAMAEGAEGPSAAHTETAVARRASSDAASATSTESFISLFNNLSSPEPHSSQSQRASTPSLSMSDQFQEVVGRAMTGKPLKHHFPQHQHHDSQHISNLQHFDQYLRLQNDILMMSHTVEPPSPVSTSPHTLNSYGLGQHYTAFPYHVYNNQGFVTPSQIWPVSHRLASASE